MAQLFTDSGSSSSSSSFSSNSSTVVYRKPIDTYKSYSSVFFDHKNVKSNHLLPLVRAVPKKKPTTTAIFFDWDDTLLSSSYLRDLGIRLDTDLKEFFDSNLDLEIPKMLDELARVNGAFLDTCQTYTDCPIFIVTNAETDWIERSTQKFLPSLWETIQKTKRVSARSTYETDACQDPQKWKEYAFDCQLRNLLREYEGLNVISCGDSMVERNAIRTVTKSFGSAVQLKNIKFIEHPDIKTMIQQIEYVHSVMNTIIKCDGELDLVTNITPAQTDQKVQMEEKHSSSTLDERDNSSDFADDDHLFFTTPSSLSVSRSTSCASLQSLDSVESVCSKRSDSSNSSTDQDPALPMSVTFATSQEKLIIVPDEI